MKPDKSQTCDGCIHCMTRWKPWRKSLWCRLYKKPATVVGCIDFERKKSGKEKQQ